MKVVFMGTPEFAVPTLEALAEGHEVVAVVTQPDKPKGRGHKMVFSPVKEAALARNIAVLQPEKVKDPAFAEQLAAFGADVFVVVAYGKILPESLLTLPPLGCINVHGSLLPKYRGPAPIHWAVLNGDTKTGVTIMAMDKGLDTGPMLLQKEMPIGPQDTTGHVHDTMAVLGAQALMETLADMANGQHTITPQNNDQASYSQMLTKDMGRLDWHNNAQTLANQVRGLNPWPCAYTTLDGQTLKLLSAEALPGQATEQPGEVVDIVPGKGFVVAAKEGRLLVTRLQAQGGKAMQTDDYLRGHPIPLGTLLC